MTAEQKKKKKTVLLWIGIAVLLCVLAGAVLLWLQSRPNAAETPQTTAAETTAAETTAAPDVTPPTIAGATDLVAYVGETVAYRAGVTAVDPEDGEVAVQVDTGAVNAAEPGTYPVVYWAEDSAGNRAEVTVQITFVEEEAEEPEETKSSTAKGEKEEKTYEELAQTVYNKIITKGMTKKEKIKAIWKWARYKISFTGSSQKGDWQRAAKTGFTKLKGDCYTYFATAKALLEIADVPTKDVVKIKKEGRSNHYWLLVKLNGSWYHFDACPRRGANGKTFCLYTDQQMLEFSEAHEDCFDFDLRKYPRTPGKIADKYLIKFYPEWFDENGNRLKDADGDLAGTPEYDPTPPKPEPKPTEPVPTEPTAPPETEPTENPTEETTPETTETIDS